jgi:hypothetical protein
MGIKTAYRKARFVAAHRSSKIVVPSSPHLDEETLTYFEARIATVSRYLEYGSGGSTVLAHKYVDSLVSVESDRHYLKAVKKVLEASPSQAETHLIPVNIGLTEQWGKPVFKKPTARRVRRWRAYPKAPWTFYEDRKVEPDLILVDGRFRVACVLESLLNQSENSLNSILLDDYSDRPYFSVVNEFADLIDLKGRMGVFQKKPQMDRERCQLALDGFYSDFR